MKQRLPKDLKVSDRVQARGHAACGLESCINQDGVCMRCLWTVKEACDLAFRLDHESILSRSGLWAKILGEEPLFSNLDLSLL